MSKPEAGTGGAPCGMDWECAAAAAISSHDQTLTLSPDPPHPLPPPIPNLSRPHRVMQKARVRRPCCTASASRQLSSMMGLPRRFSWCTPAAPWRARVCAWGCMRGGEGS